MGFWVLSGAIVLLLLIWVLWPLTRRQNLGGERRASYDMQVFKDQLSELDKDQAKGVLSEAEVERSRAEVSRRLLAAADAESTERATADAPPALSLVAAACIVGVIVIGTLLTYQKYGTPEAPDFPHSLNLALQAKMAADQELANASRPSQEDAEKIETETRAALSDGALPVLNAENAELAELVEQLSTAMATRPDDLTGHQMLARNLASLERFVEARHAQDNVMRILGADAGANDFMAHAEILIYAAGGYVSPDAFSSLAKAYERSPTNPRIRYFAGIAANQYGHPEQAYQLWMGLLNEGPEDAPWIPAIRAQIGAIAQAAGIEPDGLAGPTAEDVEAASDMNADDRENMIRNMVAGLADRLATDGGSAEEWARLIGAYGVLGETENAAAIWAEAQQVFADDPALSAIQRAAAQAGVAQ